MNKINLNTRYNYSAVSLIIWHCSFLYVLLIKCFVSPTFTRDVYYRDIVLMISIVWVYGLRPVHRDMSLAYNLTMT